MNSISWGIQLQRKNCCVILKAYSRLTEFISLFRSARRKLQHYSSARCGKDKRNEISGSFYTIIELPPLDESSTKQLLATKGHRVDKDQAYALCLMSAGNQRELIRIAGATLGYDVGLSKGSEGQIISSTMKEESSALLTEIIRSSSASGSGSLSSGAKSSAWQALSPAYFESVDSFVSLGREAIVKYWDVPWVDQSWNSVSEPWRRLLVRLFVSASWLELCNNAHANCDSISEAFNFYGST